MPGSDADYIRTFSVTNAEQEASVSKRPATPMPKTLFPGGKSRDQENVLGDLGALHRVVLDFRKMKKMPTVRKLTVSSARRLQTICRRQGAEGCIFIWMGLSF